MKFRSIIIFPIIFILFICSCNTSTSFDRTPLPQPIKYTVTQKSFFLNEKNVAFSINSMNNMLLINMEIDALKNCPFPINQQYKDTLANTFFHFDFYCNGKIIQTDYRQLQNTGNWFTDSSATKSDLSISTDTVNLKTKNQLLVCPGLIIVINAVLSN